MIGPIILLGALLGVRHALEADHIAAVASLATRARSTREIIKVSAAWGFGHALSLFLFGSLLVALGATLSDQVSRGLELVVGLMLVALGIDVLRRLRKGRVHLHSHEHTDGTVHLHAHRHERVPPRPRHPIRHEHEHTPLSRALLVGSVHGLAGSAALILVTTQTTDSVVEAVGYLLAFGVGSVAGMVAFSLIISVPVARLSARHFEKSWSRVEAGLGCLTIAIGGWVVLQAGGF